MSNAVKYNGKMYFDCPLFRISSKTGRVVASHSVRLRTGEVYTFKEEDVINDGIIATYKRIPFVKFIGDGIVVKSPEEVKEVKEDSKKDDKKSGKSKRKDNKEKVKETTENPKIDVGSNSNEDPETNVEKDNKKSEDDSNNITEDDAVISEVTAFLDSYSEGDLIALAMDNNVAIEEGDAKEIMISKIAKAIPNKIVELM